MPTLNLYERKVESWITLLFLSSLIRSYDFGSIFLWGKKFVDATKTNAIITTLPTIISWWLLIFLLQFVHQKWVIVPYLQRSPCFYIRDTLIVGNDASYSIMPFSVDCYCNGLENLGSIVIAMYNNRDHESNGIPISVVGKDYTLRWWRYGKLSWSSHEHIEWSANRS